MSHELHEKRGPIYQERKEDVPAGFYHWIAEARDMVADNFPNEQPSAHNLLVIETAKSMMMMHELSEIELSLNDIRTVLKNNARRQ